MRRVALVSVILLAATLRALSQAPQAPPPQLPTFRGGTNLVQVDAIVADADGRPIVDLTASDFALLDDGRPVPIDRARMGELRVIEPLLAFVRQLPPADLAAVYYPLDSVTDVAFTRDREPVMKRSEPSMDVAATTSRSARSKKSI